MHPGPQGLQPNREGKVSLPHQVEKGRVDGMARVRAFIGSVVILNKPKVLIGLGQTPLFVTGTGDDPFVDARIKRGVNCHYTS